MMIRPIKYVLATLVVFSQISLGNVDALANTPLNKNIKIFHYDDLAQSKKELITAFHNEGYIIVRGVPNFVETYKEFLQESKKFTRLTPAQQAKCQPDDQYIRGWSYGIESFHGVKDAFKGSYYAKIPSNNNNVWPIQDVPGFENAYVKLGNIVFNTGQKILPLIGLNLKDLSGTGRMLYYAPVNSQKNDSSQYWCGIHRDHGLFTGLCPAVYINNKGKIVEKKDGSGLYIRSQPISIPKDCLAFQIGETAELLSNGQLTATEHWVKKAYGNEKRYTFAFFFDLDPATIIHSSVTKYNDRFKDGMTYKEWNDNSLAKYNEVK